MPHAIIRGKNGRRHEVSFDNGPVRVEIHPSEETVEILIEADFKSISLRERVYELSVPRNGPEPGLKDASEH